MSAFYREGVYDDCMKSIGRVRGQPKVRCGSKHLPGLTGRRVSSSSSVLANLSTLFPPSVFLTLILHKLTSGIVHGSCSSTLTIRLYPTSLFRLLRCSTDNGSSSSWETPVSTGYCRNASTTRNDCYALASQRVRCEFVSFN